MIKRVLAAVLLVLPCLVWGQSKLPLCPEYGARHNCIGSHIYPNGGRYVGEFQNNLAEGEGISYRADGSINQSGSWFGDTFGRSYSLSPSRFPFDLQERLRAEPVTPAKSPDYLLPVCPAIGYKHNCFGELLEANGNKYVGEIQNNKREGLGIFYLPNGVATISGKWGDNRFIAAYSLDPARFPFDFASQAKGIWPTDPSKVERDRLTAEVEAERKERQNLEQRLAEAEAKERERQQAQAPHPQRPQLALRNERRLALVIGNSSYKVSPLDNPANDANDVAESLKKFGFQTTLVRNATLGQMREATRKFADQLPSADVALIYFGGHGIESNRKNYMIPVNADLKFEYELADQGYDAGIWLEMLESIKSNNADRVNIVILDACRNNSLIGSRNLGRGLGKMDAPSGTFLAYSTAPGKVAADGGRGERNSPFTKHLIRAMQQPNQPIEEVFKEVRRNVGKETNGAQVPWESTSLTGFFAFRQGK